MRVFFLFVAFLVTFSPAALASITFNFTAATATFTPAGDVDFTGGDQSNLLDFSLDTPTLPAFTLIGVGDSEVILLGTMTLIEENGIQGNESDGLGLTVGFSLDHVIGAVSFVTTAFTADSTNNDVLATFGSLNPRTINFGSTGQLAIELVGPDHTVAWSGNTNSDPQGVFVQFTLVQADVPEPSTYLMLTTGLIGIGLLRRWRR